MSYDLNHAETILLDAGNEIRRANAEHGHTEKSFAMVAELWSTYIRHALTFRGHHNLSPYDIAQMLSLLKKARSIYGNSRDNFVDDTGYTSLAGMLKPKEINNEPV